MVEVPKPNCKVVINENAKKICIDGESGWDDYMDTMIGKEYKVSKVYENYIFVRSAEFEWAFDYGSFTVVEGDFKSFKG